MKIRLLIIDDHTMVRTSLAMSLEAFDDIELVGQAGNAQEGIALCFKTCPDVVLMDLIMPEMSGVAAIHVIMEQKPQTRIIALSSFIEDELVHDALEAGAISYMLKNATINDLVRAIRDAYSFRPTLAPEATQILIRQTRHSHLNPNTLSEREQEVLALMVDGLTNKEIGHHLALSLSTVKFHVSSILAKLNAASRTEAVAVAIHKNLIS